MEGGNRSESTSNLWLPLLLTEYSEIRLLGSFICFDLEPLMIEAAPPTKGRPLPPALVARLTGFVDEGCRASPALAAEFAELRPRNEV